MKALWVMALLVLGHMEALRSLRCPLVLQRSLTRAYSKKQKGLVGHVVHKARLVDADSVGIAEAGAWLRAGRLVAFPTETVYGLGANALDVKSCCSIFAAKQRPMSDPLIVHVSSFEDTAGLLEYEDDVEEGRGGRGGGRAVVALLCKAFWPGPLTVIHKAAAAVPSEVTASTGYVGVRSPMHPTARAILKAAGVPVAAPSANRFGHVSPTSHLHVLRDLGDQDIMVLRDTPDDDGAGAGTGTGTSTGTGTGVCAHGIESTVCRVAQDGRSVHVLRAGPVTPTMLSDVLRRAGLASVVITFANSNSNGLAAAVGVEVGALPESAESSDQLKVKTEAEATAVTAAVAPGQMLKHYAPDVPTTILSSNLVHNAPWEAQRRVRGGLVVDYGGRLKDIAMGSAAQYWDLSPGGDARQACRGVFALLRLAEDCAAGAGDGSAEDGKGVRLFLPDLRADAAKDEVVMALWERLLRAASGRYESENIVGTDPGAAHEE